MCEMDMYFDRERYQREEIEVLPFVRKVLREDKANSNLIKVTVKIKKEWEDKMRVLSLLERYSDFVRTAILSEDKREEFRDILSEPEFTELANHKCLGYMISAKLTEDFSSVPEEVSLEEMPRGHF